MTAIPGGLLVVIEGIDGAGKTTLADTLAARLTALGVEVVRSKEPTNGPHGQALRATAATGRLAPDRELELLLADRRDHVRDLIGPALARGALVILDRYYYSNAAYQGSAGLDVDDVLDANRRFAPTPDLLLLLDLPVRVGLQRIAARGDRANAFESTETLERVREIFQRLAADHGVVIDASAGADEVASQAMQAVSALLDERRNATAGGAMDATAPVAANGASRG